MEQQIVALSGPDNVGKSTQLRILARRFPSHTRLAGPLREHDPRWEPIITGGLASWWFEASSAEEFVDVLALSYLARHDVCDTSGLTLIDRGIPMLEATVAATLSVREQLDQAAARERTVVLLSAYADRLSVAEQRETSVALLHSFDAEASARESLSRELVADERYSTYQRHLARQILWQAGAGRYEHVVVADRPIMPIQAEIRRVLGNQSPQISGCPLSECQVIAFGGMSEGGKSTAAAWMDRAHDYTRLKIGYLLEQAATVHGVDDIYACDDVEQAELLVDSLDRFTAAHIFAKRLTIESLHRFGATQALKALLGNGLTIAYVDACEEARFDRGVDGPADVILRDAVKTGRGARQIRDVSDVVLDNNGSPLSLRHQLNRLRNHLAWPQVAPRIKPAGSLGLPANVAQLVGELVSALTTDEQAVDLIAVTGSGGRGKYQEGWSDVDVLIIADTDKLPIVRDAAARLRAGLAAVKLGLTLITAEECFAGALTPRLIHTLRQISTGEIGVQWCRSELHLPLPSHDDDECRSLQDGTIAAIEIRRQLMRPVGTRALFKITALLAKVMLRVDARDSDDDETALTRFADLNLQGCTADLVASAKHDSDAGARLARAVVNAWLSTLTLASPQ